MLTAGRVLVRLTRTGDDGRVESIMSWRDPRELPYIQRDPLGHLRSAPVCRARAACAHPGCAVARRLLAAGDGQLRVEVIVHGGHA